MISKNIELKCSDSFHELNKQAFLILLSVYAYLQRYCALFFILERYSVIAIFSIKSIPYNKSPNSFAH